MATDPTTGRRHAERVVAVITTTDDTEFTDLTVAAPGGPARLTSTWHHPFWDATRQAFTDAATLAVGDQLREPDGHLVPVLAVTNYHAHHTTYNLTTDTLHTYYVTAGTTPILVHNACGTGLKGASKGLTSIFSQGGVRGKSIIGIRSSLVGDGFTQQLANSRSGYLFTKGKEEVRVMRRDSGWDIRIKNQHGNYLDEFGNVSYPKAAHKIEVFSR